MRIALSQIICLFSLFVFKSSDGNEKEHSLFYERTMTQTFRDKVPGVSKKG